MNSGKSRLTKNTYTVEKPKVIYDCNCTCKCSRKYEENLRSESQFSLPLSRKTVISPTYKKGLKSKTCKEELNTKISKNKIDSINKLNNKNEILMRKKVWGSTNSNLASSRCKKVLETCPEKKNTSNVDLNYITKDDLLKEISIMAAIVCPEKDEAERRTKVLCKLRDLIEKAEQDISVGVRQIQLPGSEAPPPMEPTKTEKKNGGPPDVMVCYKLPSKGGTSWEDEGIPLSNSKSRELRGGQLFLGCYCCKKNGLQDDCPRAECQGSPACLMKPPMCGPVAYCDAKHLQAKAAKFLSRGKENPKEQKMKYKCFPATVKPPEVPCCVTTCIYDS